MKIINSSVSKILGTELENLDPVSIYLEEWVKKVDTDKEFNQGKVIITCYDRCYSAFFGSMGIPLKEFILSTDNGYLCNKLTTLDNYVNDYDQISKDCGESVDEHSINFQHKLLEEAYGNEWFIHGLPQTNNPEVKIVCRILDAVRAILIESNKEA